MFSKNVHNIKKNGIIAMAMILVMVPFVGEAANLLTGSSKAQISVGETATVSFYVDTSNTFINNAESTISFSKDILDIVSINTSSSIFGLWVEQPSFSNTTGTITFNGGVANPGYQGSRGLLFSAVVKAKKTGTATFSFGTSAVRANDGLGTDVLNQKTGVSISVNAAIEKPIESEPVVPQTIVPQIVPLGSADLDFFEVVSSTHPDQSLWYASNNVDLKWPLSKGVTGIRMTLDANPNTELSGKIEKPTALRSIKGLKDGVSYFHVQQIASGKFSQVAHFAINVDTVAPFNTDAHVYRNENNQLVLDLQADDSTSGVDYFQVMLDGNDLGKITAVNGTAQFIFPENTSIGKHSLEVDTYDFARNKQDIILPITVEPFMPPVVTIAIKNFVIERSMIVTGEKSGINQSMNVFIHTPDQKIETYQVVTNDKGVFSIKNRITTSGTYEVWVEPIGDMKNFMKPVARQIVHVPGNILYSIYRTLDKISPLLTLTMLGIIAGFLRKRKRVKSGGVKI